MKRVIEIRLEDNPSEYLYAGSTLDQLAEAVLVSLKYVEKSGVFPALCDESMAATVLGRIRVGEFPVAIEDTVKDFKMIRIMWGTLRGFTPPLEDGFVVDNLLRLNERFWSTFSMRYGLFSKEPVSGYTYAVHMMADNIEEL